MLRIFSVLIKHKQFLIFQHCTFSVISLTMVTVTIRAGLVSSYISEYPPCPNHFLQSKDEHTCVAPIIPNCGD